MCLFLGAAAGAMGGIGTAISAVSTIAGIGMQIMQAGAANQAAQAQYQNEVAHRRQQEVQAQKTLNLQVSQQQMALESEKDKAQGAKAEMAIEGYAAESRAITSAAESGIVGFSLENLIGDIRGRTGRALGKTDYNAAVATANAGNELKMAQRGMGARLAEIPIPVKPRFNMGLEIGSAVVSGLGSLGSLMSSSSRTRVGYDTPSGSYMS